MRMMKKPQYKKLKCHVAEWSIRSSVAYSMAVAAAHWVPGQHIKGLHVENNPPCLKVQDYAKP